MPRSLWWRWRGPLGNICEVHNIKTRFWRKKACWGRGGFIYSTNPRTQNVLKTSIHGDGLLQYLLQKSIKAIFSWWIQIINTIFLENSFICFAASTIVFSCSFNCSFPLATFHLNSPKFYFFEDIILWGWNR